MSDQPLTQPAFVHPLEEAFARILNYYGILWEYEPRTFALEKDAQGRMLSAFTPDFYLPDQDLYIELTTLRPQLIRNKNRKLRRLRELYPEINIKLFKRSDLRNMMIKYGMTDEVSQILGTDAQDQE